MLGRFLGVFFIVLQGSIRTRNVGYMHNRFVSNRLSSWVSTSVKAQAFLVSAASNVPPRDHLQAGVGYVAVVTALGATHTRAV